MAITNAPAATGWHSRGYLPHWEAGEVAQSITFRLADSLPSALLDRWETELQVSTGDARDQARRQRIERALDSGHGSGALKRPDVGEIVERTLLHFDGERYRLHAWVVMPNHVHVLTTPLGRSLSDIVQNWKSFTSRSINNLLSQRGTFWAPEYFDRVVRDEVHFTNALGYIAMNPVKAGLCGAAEDWRFSSAWKGRSAPA
jgi:putative DNA methylase